MINSKNKRFLIATIVVQLMLFLVVTYGDFGFYFPGSMGAYGDWCMWVLFYLSALTIGVVAAIWCGEYRLALIELSIPFITVLLYFFVISLQNPSSIEPDVEYNGKTVHNINPSIQYSEVPISVSV